MGLSPPALSAPERENGYVVYALHSEKVTPKTEASQMIN